MSNEIVSTNERAVVKTDKLCELAQEIITIKSQTSVFLSMVEDTVRRSCFEIGKRLVEAKTLVPYGEWGNWLQDNVDYSESTAQNLMRIHKEMGDTQIDMLTGKAPVEIFGNLQYSQLVAMFALPPAERAEFVASTPDIENKSVREIDQLIDDLRKRAEDAEIKAAKLDKAETKTKDLEALVKESKATVEKKKTEADKLRAELKELKDKPTQEVIIQKAEVSEEEITQIKAQAEKEAMAKYNEKAESLSADIEEREKALDQAKTDALKESNEKIAALEKKLTLAANDKIKEVNFHFTEARDHLIDVVSAILEISKSQPEIAEKLKGAILRQIDEITKPLL